MKKYQNEEKSPFVLSYPQSAGGNFIYKMILVVLSIGAAIVGKASMPYDSVQVIKDSFLYWTRPTTIYLDNHQYIASILMAISNLIVDSAFVGMSLLWYFRIDSIRYAFSAAVFAAIKVIIITFFQLQEIPHHINMKLLLPTILGPVVFRHDYFFNAHCGLLFIIYLELKNIGYNKAARAVFCGCFYVAFVSLVLRHDYFMDIFVGLVTAHLVYRLTYKYQELIGKLLEQYLQIMTN